MEISLYPSVNMISSASVNILANIFLHIIVWFGVLFKNNNTSNYSNRFDRPEPEGRESIQF